ncbi:MAG: helix-turn-helix transcriptional regulator, partial [Clostridia bacterium]|nr:helix-turn-helix transcriptional regulator [Clostridia bacterium]
MKLGEKIRLARQNIGMTQAQLAGDFITRNMLSQIENGLAMPSLQTALYIADRLGMDAGILFSDTDDKSIYFVTRKLPVMKQAYAENDYDKCIELCSQEDEQCDEAVLLLAECYIKKAYASYKEGKLRTALKISENAVKCAGKCIYSADSIKLKAEALEVMISSASPYVKQSKRKDDEIKILKECFVDITGQKHIYNKSAEVKKLVEEGKYDKACGLIKSLLREKNIDVPLVYELYTDLEICYREMKDFENAYDVTSKAKQIFN